MLQALPSQCSISVSVLLVSEWPTAHTSVALTAATAVRVFRELFAAFGLGTIFHFAPYQCSMSVRCWIGAGAAKSPTAQTSFAETAATPRSSELVAEPFGLGTMLHLLPSQCSIRVLL